MNLAAIRGMVLQRLDEDPTGQISGTWTDAEVDAAINEGQMLMVLITLCLEATFAFQLAAATWNYNPFAQLPDWIAPLRCRMGGLKVRAARMADLDALDTAWRAKTRDAASRYGTLGWSLIYFYPQLKASGSVDLTYARSPVVMVADTDVPEVPEQHHNALADYGVYHCRQKLGGLELEKGLAFLARFFESSKQLGTFTRARALGERYDTIPVELERFDLSRLVKVRKDILPLLKEGAASAN